MHACRSLVCLLFLIMLGVGESPAESHRPEPFGIQVVDRATGRGVPLVRLRTVHEAVWVTDNAGWAAFDEPGLLGREVFFFVESDGYEYPADGFGFHGVRLVTKPGGEARLEVERTMIAERMYRLTGAGMYRDSLLLGKQVPLREPLLNARVIGQDSVQTALYRGRLLWFWGDTSRPEYPLGNFATSGAVSLLPAQGGLDPSVGVDLDYFTNEAGFARAMVDIPGDGLKWIDGLMVLQDPEGEERLVARCERVRNLGEQLGRSLVVYDDATDTFRPLVDFDPDSELFPGGHPISQEESGTEYFLFPTPFPFVRVPADWQAIQDPAMYEGYTCLDPSIPYDAADPAILRDGEGRPAWQWRRGAPPLGAGRQREMIEAGHLDRRHAAIDVREVGTDKAVLLWGGTVSWNAHRGRWIMVANEMWGKPSNLGEVWLAEAPRPEGPWLHAVKIITHARHSFYNPAHHPFLDQEGGRVIFLEGTYSEMFSDHAVPTPRYNYNQVMYRVDLSDPRLAFPEPGVVPVPPG